MAVETLGISAAPLTGGRTAYSTFKWPLNLIQKKSPSCSILKKIALAALLTDIKLIAWYEAILSRKPALETLDRTLQGIRNNKKIMGHVTVPTAVDFRQGRWAESLHQALMNLRDNKYGTKKWCCLNLVNLNLMSQFSGIELSYTSLDTFLYEEHVTLYPMELNKPPEFSPHILTLKIGDLITLLRKIDVSRLWNETRLLVKTAVTYVLEVRITGNKMYYNVFIPIPKILIILNNLQFQCMRA